MFRLEHSIDVPVGTHRRNVPVGTYLHNVPVRTFMLSVPAEHLDDLRSGVDWETGTKRRL